MSTDSLTDSRQILDRVRLRIIINAPHEAALVVTRGENRRILLPLDGVNRYSQPAEAACNAQSAVGDRPQNDYWNRAVADFHHAAFASERVGSTSPKPRSVFCCDAAHLARSLMNIRLLTSRMSDVRRMKKGSRSSTAKKAASSIPRNEASHSISFN